MLTLTEKERNCTGLHRDTTQLLIFSAIKIPQLTSQPTSHYSNDDNNVSVHCESKTTIHLTSDHNFGKCTLIYKILALSDS